MKLTVGNIIRAMGGEECRWRICYAPDLHETWMDIVTNPVPGELANVDWSEDRQMSPGTWKMVPSSNAPYYDSVFGCGVILSETSMLAALSKCCAELPKLHIAPAAYGCAYGIAPKNHVSIVVDPILHSTEWYVEWQGKRVGSFPG